MTNSRDFMKSMSSTLCRKILMKKKRNSEELNLNSSKNKKKRGRGL